MTTELLPPKTRLRVNELARNVLALKSSYYEGNPAEDTSLKNMLTRNAFRSNGITAKLFPPWTRLGTI